MAPVQVTRKGETDEMHCNKNYAMRDVLLIVVGYGTLLRFDIFLMAEEEDYRKPNLENSDRLHVLVVEWLSRNAVATTV